MYHEILSSNSLDSALLSQRPSQRIRDEQWVKRETRKGLDSPKSEYLQFPRLGSGEDITRIERIGKPKCVAPTEEVLALQPEMKLLNLSSFASYNTCRFSEASFAKHPLEDLRGWSMVLASVEDFRSLCVPTTKAYNKLLLGG